MAVVSYVPANGRGGKTDFWLAKFKKTFNIHTYILEFQIPNKLCLNFNFEKKKYWIQFLFIKSQIIFLSF